MPLYRQVAAILKERITQGAWRPGEALPAEPRLADELGVSQGTVRKALDELAQRRLVVRRQGSGTFVAKQTAETALFHFFHLEGADGRPLTPESRVLRQGHEQADAASAARLGLEEGAPVARIERLRFLDGVPRLVESIVVPLALFPDFARASDPPVPNTLYDLYQQRYGITVARADERLWAEAAPPELAARLGIEAGTALMAIDRLAFDYAERAVECRLSRVRTDGLRYRVQLA